MRKINLLLVVLLCLSLAGCSNEFAKLEYDSNEKISQEADRYAKGGSIFNSIDGGYSLTVSQFDGRETLWSMNIVDDKNVDLEMLLGEIG